MELAISKLGNAIWDSEVRREGQAEAEAFRNDLEARVDLLEDSWWLLRVTEQVAKCIAGNVPANRGLQKRLCLGLGAPFAAL